MADELEPDGELKTISLVNESTGEEEEYLVHDVVDLEGKTYYIVQARSDAEKVLILRRDGEALVSLEDDERDRVMALLEELEEEQEDEQEDGNARPR